jgi:Fur family ferric uptake transcriptional regulator
MRTRNTRQKSTIRDVFEKADRPLSVDDVRERAGKKIARLGIATVYRSINALLAEGWLDAVQIPGEPVRYERTGKEHHHHFHCKRCERVFDVTGCVKNIKELVPPAFRLHDHMVTLYGLCSQCAAA